MGGAVKSVSKVANKAVGGATKAIGNVVKETAKAPGAVAGLLGGKKKVPGEAGYDAAVDGVADDSAQPFSGLANQLGVNPASNGTEQKAFNPFTAPKRAGFVLPKFNQMQARMDQNGQPQQPIPGQPPQLNQGGRFKHLQQPQGPQAPQAPIPMAPQATAPAAPQAPAPGINPIQPAPAAPAPVPAAPAAPAPVATAPVQQQKDPGQPAPGASTPTGAAGEAAPTISPEDQFKKTQASLYQNK
jgi:hypothetical protein